jgi:hypothetical protein
MLIPIRGIRFTTLTLILTMLVTCLYAQGDQSMGVDIQPTSFSFSATKGEAQVRTVTINNKQDAAIQLRFYLGDWVRDSFGRHSYHPAGTLPSSCSKWLTISKEFVELAPHTSTTFDLTITVPDNEEAIKEMKWAMLFSEPVSETAAPKADPKEVTTIIERRQRLGLHVYQLPPSITAKDMRVTALQNVINIPNTYRIICQNTGSTQIVCKPYLELTAMTEEGKVSKIQADEFPMFPGQVRVVDITIPKSQPKGKYSMIAAIDAGEDIPLGAAQAEIEVK